MIPYKNWKCLCHALLLFRYDTLCASLHQPLYIWVTHDLYILTWGRSKTRQNKIQWLKAQQIQTRRHVRVAEQGDTGLSVQFAQAEKQR